VQISATATTSRTRNTHETTILKTNVKTLSFDGVAIQYLVAAGSSGASALSGMVTLLDKNNGEGVWEYVPFSSISYSFNDS
jgi:hypothetical protein